MTDRVKGLIVTLESDVREDDVESLINAIRHLRLVLDVSPVKTGYEDYMNRERVRTELTSKLFDVLKREQ